MRPDDYVCSTYRDHVHALSKGVPAKNIMAELFGKKTGICRGQGGSMHMFSAEHNLVRLSASRHHSSFFLQAAGYSTLTPEVACSSEDLLSLVKASRLDWALHMASNTER